MLGIAATWSLAFASAGLVPALAVGLAVATGAVAPAAPGSGPLPAALAVVARWAAIGALSGLVFAATVAVGERRQTIGTLSERRVRRWGMLAGSVGSAAVASVVVAFLLPGDAPPASLPLVTGLVGIPVAGGLLGRLTADASLRAARRDAALPTADATQPTQHAGRRAR
jgi:hypothetical protein